MPVFFNRRIQATEANEGNEEAGDILRLLLATQAEHDARLKAKLAREAPPPVQTPPV